MTLADAMQYRGISVGEMAQLVGMKKKTVENWMQPGGMSGMSVKRLRTIAELLDGGILITEDGAEVELYGGNAT